MSQHSTGTDEDAWKPDDADAPRSPGSDGEPGRGEPRGAGGAAARVRERWSGLTPRSRLLFGGGAVVVVVVIVLVVVLVGGATGGGAGGAGAMPQNTPVGGGDGVQYGTGPAHTPAAPPPVATADSGRLGQAKLDSYELTPRDAGYLYRSQTVTSTQHSLTLPGLAGCAKSFPSEAKRQSRDRVMLGAPGQPTVIGDLVAYKAGGATEARQELTTAAATCTTYSLPQQGTVTDVRASTDGTIPVDPGMPAATPAPGLLPGTVIITGRVANGETYGTVTTVYQWQGPVMSVVSVTAPTANDSHALALRLAAVSASRLTGH